MFVDICKYKRGEKTYTRSLLRAAYREKGKVMGITSVLGSSKSALMILWLVFARLIDQGSRLSASRLAKRHAVDLLMGLSPFGNRRVKGTHVGTQNEPTLGII